MDGKDLKIQDILSLGYLYLLVLGILRDSIFYWFLGINILNYSDVMDVLLSPLSFLAGQPLILFFVIIFVLIAFNWDRIKMIKTGKKSKDLIVETQNKNERRQNVSFFLAVGFMGFFLGTGIGGGNKIARIVESKEYEVNRIIQFSDQKTMRVKEISQNGNYIFCANPNQYGVIAIPIQGNVKSIKKIKKKKE